MGGSPGPNLRNGVILRRFPGPARPSGAAPRLARTPGDPNDLALRGLRAVAVVRPCLGELSPSLQQVLPQVRLLYATTNRMSQRKLS